MLKAKRKYAKAADTPAEDIPSSGVSKTPVQIPPYSRAQCSAKLYHQTCVQPRCENGLPASEGASSANAAKTRRVAMAALKRAVQCAGSKCRLR